DLHAARPVEIRHLLARGLRLEQGLSPGAWIVRPLRGPVLAELHPSAAGGPGGVDSCRSPASAFSTAVAQNSVGGRARQMKSAIVLLSGGLDSATALA